MRKHLLRTFAIALSMAMLSLSIQASTPDASSRKPQLPVTPVAGQSWLNHLHRSFGDTSMGKTGRLGPPAAMDGGTAGAGQLGFVPFSAEVTTLKGADLYRLNCQGCHGESGLGAPPEINSVIDPVRATSVPMVVARMKKTGMDISSSAAAELANQSQAALWQRLHSGGESMPPFPHLSDAEIRALIAYLRQLSGVPGTAQLAVVESPIRIGEHIVKSTCHTCHDATGPNPTPQQLENGAIPPLETLTARTDELQLIRKVTTGAPILMGTPATLHRGRMPVFYYLSKDEAADVYLYLSSYPPQQLQAGVPAIAGAEQNGAGGGAPPAPFATPSTPVSPTSNAGALNKSEPVPNGIPDWMVTLLLIGLGSASLGLVIFGMGFAAYELSRLSRATELKRKGSDVVSSPEHEHEVGELVMR
jgi:mono/diheme cytochrome c family protein